MSQIIHAKDLRRGNTIIYKNNLLLVLENSFNKTAMREGIVKCKVKNLRTQAITVEVLTGEKLEQAPVTKVKAMYSYSDGPNFVFIDNETFESIEFPIKKMDWEKNFITDGTEVNIMKYNDEIISVDLPEQVILEIEYAEDAVQGNSVTTALKRAKLVTGYELDVPQFIKTGERIIVNTESGTYISREKQND